MENRSMTVLSAVTGLHYLFSIPLALVCLFLTLLILVQRGRGGGLTGALGGMGGQSAFGTKAGDVFTRITIIVAAVWILLSMAAIKVLTARATAGPLAPGQRSVAPADPGKKGEGDKARSNVGVDALEKGIDAAKGETPDKGVETTEPPATPGPSLPPETEGPSLPPEADNAPETSGTDKSDDAK